MRVICIDAGNKKGGDGLIKGPEGLIEGNAYTVIRIIPPFYKERGFVLSEIRSSHFTGAFLESRFAPTSNIDEKELAEQRQELVELT